MIKDSNKLVILVAIFFIFVTGCLRNYFQNEDDYKKEIKEYIEEKVGLKDYELSDTFEEVKGEDDSVDKVWTVKDKNGISFHVIDDYYYSMESMTNVLEDDYSKTVFYKFYDELEKKDNITVEEIKDRSISFVSLKCLYTNKDEIIKCFESLKAYADFYKSKVDNVTLSYTLVNKTNYDSLADFVSYIGSTNKIDQDVIDEVMLHYNTYGVYYQDNSITSKLSSEELDKVLNNKEVQKVVGTKYIAKNNSISFETLYHLLKDNKYRVTGNQNKFTVYDKAGTRYDFSNSFYNLEDNGYRAYYYLKKNEQVRTNSSISTSAIYDLFALSITLENNK